MWHARRSYTKPQPRSLGNLFRCWRQICHFTLLQKQIRLMSRQNKCHRLDNFMQESADLALCHEILDWNRRIRQLNPK